MGALQSKNQVHPIKYFFDESIQNVIDTIKDDESQGKFHHKSRPNVFNQPEIPYDYTILSWPEEYFRVKCDLNQKGVVDYFHNEFVRLGAKNFAICSKCEINGDCIFSYIVNKNKLDSNKYPVKDCDYIIIDDSE